MTPEQPQRSTVDVQCIMREIRSRLRGTDGEQEWMRQARRTVPSHLSSSIARLIAGAASLRSSIAAIGQPPPSPPTWRGRLGMLGVRLMQRSTFWLIPSIHTAHLQAADMMEKHLRATDELIAALQQTNIELAKLRAALPEQAGNGEDQSAN